MEELQTPAAVQYYSVSVGNFEDVFIDKVDQKTLYTFK